MALQGNTPDNPSAMPVLRLGVRDQRIQARIRYWFQRICLLEWRLPNEPLAEVETTAA